jgi:hypothetical protein
MSYLSLFRSGGERYDSVAWLESRRRRGVRFGVRRISLGRRLEFAAAVAELARTAEFAAAGDSLRDRAAAKVAQTEIDRLYLRWGLAGVAGLDIDGAPATAESLFDSGPEDLANEILGAIKAEWGLTEAERKN